VQTWNSAEIKKLNPTAALPDIPIRLIYRPEGKGTNYVFTDFLSKTSPRFRAFIGVTASPDWPFGTSANTSSDMIDAVKKTVGSIGYVELQYAEANKVQFGSVANLFGRFVKASPETITAACEAVEYPSWDKFSASLTNAKGTASYPITGFTWAYLRTKNTDPRRALALRQLLNWILTDGQPFGKQLGYSELPAPLLEKLRAELNSNQLF
jgi:phosphate transport system substrate-binding protein